MIITTYTCDKCKKTQDTGEQMWVIELRVVNLTHSTDYDAPKLRQEWCRECTERAGWLPSRLLKKEELPPPTTLEDLIHDIVREEVSHA